jgi:hypothetical protein
VSKDYSDKMEAWLKKQPMRNANGLSISDTYTTMKLTPIEDRQPMSIFQPKEKKVDTKKLNEYRALMLGHGWREPRVVENVLPYLKSKIS